MVEIVQRGRLEVLCVQETRWKGDSARRLVGGYKLLHVGGDGMSNGMVNRMERDQQAGGQSGKMGGRDGNGMGDDTEANGVCYVGILATKLKGWGVEAGSQ